MNSAVTLSERITNTKACVIIPTYNNHKTLRRVVDGVLHYTNNVIVVNDGSTDTTKEILSSYPQITQIHIPKNRGKGNALREGFKKAKELQYEYAITIDSDGQHFPDDIPVFLDALELENAPILLIGSRNMNQDDVPKKSSFGNKFSNFWFWFETGIRLEDTQSGYRLYPLQFIPNKLFTNKFEFEIEVIVRTAWNGVPVKNIPIKILYDPSERVTHFRPFKDFTRISILNIILVVITLLYIKPRDFFRSFKKKSFKKFVRENILESTDSNSKKAASIALGVFVGIAPFWGFQTAIVILLAIVLRWNKVLAFAFSNISIPPMIPIIIYGSLQIGALFVTSKAELISGNKTTFELIQNNLMQYVIGSFVLATVTAILFGITSYLLLSFSRKLSK
jgi:glycosyltransferase involved in cell wall biosynthesis